jgi:DNA-binding transcriptional LysR family regulator
VELRQLEHFVAAAEAGHFTRAAGRCHISQSALSTSIRSLERELGVPLFARTTRKVELTEAGRVLLDEARGTLAAATSARNAVLAMRGLLRGSLTVGGIPTPGQLDQAALLARFRDRYPAVHIRYVRDTSMALIPEVESSRLDVAFVSLPSYEAVDRVFARAGQERRVPFEVNDILAILDFVACGLGVTLVQECLATSRPDLRAIPLADTDLTWTLAAIVSRHRATPAARAFLALLPAAEPAP